MRGRNLKNKRKLAGVRVRAQRLPDALGVQHLSLVVADCWGLDFI